MQKYGIIYKITNKINGKVYIGQTIRKYGFRQRYSYDLAKNTKNLHLKSSIEKYGIENFNIDEEFDIAYSKEELDNKEKYWISYYKSNNTDFGYNLQDGGSNGKPTQEVRERMSKNNPKYLLGKHHTEETKKKIGARLKGRKLAPLKEETKLKISKTLTGRKLPIETKIKIKKSRENINQYGKNNPMARAVRCITTGKEFETLKEASEYYNTYSSSIVKSCNNNYYSCGKSKAGEKLYWEYISKGE